MRVAAISIGAGYGHQITRTFRMRSVETIPVGNTLGECVLWDERTGAVWWTDIEGRAVYRLGWQDRQLERFATPARLTSFGFIAGGSGLVAAFDGGFALFDPVTGVATPLLRPDGLAPGMRLNDGRVDRQGRFWCGSMVEEASSPRDARLYVIGGGAVTTRERGLAIANGLCWSPDNAWCYLADSGRGIIWRYRFDDVTGNVSGREEFARSRGGAVPDGAAVDCEGYLWSAQWGGSCVIRYTPDGRIDRVVELPVSQPSCVAFGGPDFDLLYVTTARAGLKTAQTGAGDLFVYNAPVRGSAECRFNIDAWPETAGTLG